jgi:hypothetical protein
MWRIAGTRDAAGSKYLIKLSFSGLAEINWLLLQTLEFLVTNNTIFTVLKSQVQTVLKSLHNYFHGHRLPGYQQIS